MAKLLRHGRHRKGKPEKFILWSKDYGKVTELRVIARLEMEGVHIQTETMFESGRRRLACSCTLLRRDSKGNGEGTCPTEEEIKWFAKEHPLPIEGVTAST